MVFKIKTHLAQRGAIESEPDEYVGGILLVGKSVITYTEYERAPKYGHDYVTLSPAVYKGEKAWLICKTWQPARGYCAYGSYEKILSFDQGIKILVEKKFFSDHLEE